MQAIFKSHRQQALYQFHLDYDFWAHFDENYLFFLVLMKRSGFNWFNSIFNWFHQSLCWLKEDLFSIYRALSLSKLSGLWENKIQNTALAMLKNNWLIRQLFIHGDINTWEVLRALKKLGSCPYSYASLVLSKRPKCFI